MVDHPTLRQSIGVIIIAVGGLSFILSGYMVASRIPGPPGAGLVGTYFETASLLHIPLWLVGGIVLIFVGFAIIPRDSDADQSE